VAFNAIRDVVPKRKQKIKLWRRLEHGSSTPQAGTLQTEVHAKHDGALFGMSFQGIVEKLENKIAYYKETVGCQHVIFCPLSQVTDYHHAEKLEPSRRVTISEVFLSEQLVGSQENCPVKLYLTLGSTM
jgi:hypothetical protein